MYQGAFPQPVDGLLQRARGAGRIRVGHHGVTRLDRLYQDGCAKIRLPRSAEARGVEAVLINTAGGLTGGDVLAWGATAGECADLAITTQACERIYRSPGGDAVVRCDLVAETGASLAWLPQETILFDGAGLSRTLDAEVAAGARLLVVEAVILGRQAMGETVRVGRLRDRWRVRRAGRLVFADDLRLEGPVAATAELAPVLAGKRAFATLLLVDDAAEPLLGPVRAALGALGGASAFDGRLIARVAAPDGLTLRRALVPALEALHGAPLPRVWRS